MDTQISLELRDAMTKYRLLSADDERAYAEAFRNRGDLFAARVLFLSNLRLVVVIARGYHRAWSSLMDLIQEGNVGLAEAVLRFDPSRDTRFASFARNWIKSMILAFILKNSRAVSFASTRAGRKLFFRLEKERRRLMEETGEATRASLAAVLDVKEAAVNEVAAALQAELPLSAMCGESDDRPLAEVLGDTDQAPADEQVASVQVMNRVKYYLATFAQSLRDDRERAIWSRRLLTEDPVSLAELGETFGVSRERIRQVEAQIKKDLRDYLEKRGITAEIFT